MITLTYYYKQIKKICLFLAAALSSNIVMAKITDINKPDCEVMFADVHHVNWEGDGKNIGYNVFSKDAVTQAIRFEIIRTNGTNACQIAIGVSNTASNGDTKFYLTNAGNMTTDNIQYNLFVDNAATTPWHDYNSTNFSMQNMILVSFGPLVTISDNEGDTTSNTNQQVNRGNTDEEEIIKMRNLVTQRANQDVIDKQEFIVYWNIPALQMVNPGIYDSHLILTAYEIKKSGFVPKDQQSLTLSTRVKDTINCSIGKSNVYLPGAPNKYKINFGLLDIGKPVEDDFYLVVRSNTNFKYQLHSENDGVLSLEDNINNGRKTKLPYELFIDNKLYNFKTDLIYERTEKMTTLDGASIPIKISISGDLNLVDYTAGTYHDSVYITISTE